MDMFEVANAKPVQGMVATAALGNPNDFNTYQVAYKPLVSMSMGGGWSGMERVSCEIKNYHEEQEFRGDIVKHPTTPPTGRNQKSHNLIQAMNQKSKRY